MEGIPRYVEEQMWRRIGQQKVLILYGTRRTGKTHILEQLFARFKGKKLQLNGEDLSVQRRLAERTSDNYSGWFGGLELLIIDEAQNIADVGKVLKFIIDTIKPLTVVVSGSSSFDIANKSGEPLTGRSYTYQLYPVAQSEMAETQATFELYNALDDRLRFGSYPEIMFMKSDSDREEYLTDLVNAYLFKDILAFDGIRNAEKVKQLLQLVALQMGSEVSYNELSRTLGINKITVERYLDLLHKNFILFPLKGYGSNERNEVTKSSKWYFYDCGVRNALINHFEKPSFRLDKGALFENFMIAERLKYHATRQQRVSFHFWRNYDKQEIDLLEKHAKKLDALEFKFAQNKLKTPPAFKRNYPTAKVELVNRDNFLRFLV